MTTIDRTDSFTGGAAAFPLFVLVALQFLDQATQSAFNVLIPNVRDAFGLSDATILLIAALAAAAALLGTLPIAWLADRTSRVRIVLVGAVASAAFSVGLGLAPTAVVLGVMLCGVAVGQAVIFPTHNSLLADFYPVGTRPRIYSTHRAGLSLGVVAGVLIGAGLTDAFSWRVPFIAFAVPIVGIAVAGLWLREPARGVHEEAAMPVAAGPEAAMPVAAGPEAAMPVAAGPEAAMPVAAGPEAAARPGEPPVTVPPEPPPSFGEAWRMVWKIGVLRRIFVALPFLAAAIAGFTSLASLQYQQTFHLDVTERAMLTAPVQIFVLGGLVVGATVGTRLARRSLRSVFTMLAVAAAVASAFAVLFSLAPSVPFAFVGDAGIEASLAVVAPGVLAALSLAVPPRSRSVGFSVGALFILPGLVVIPVVGAVGDAVGFRYGMLVLVPVFLIGGLILASAGSSIDDDVRDVWVATRTRREMLEARARGELPLLVGAALRVGYGGAPVLRDVDIRIAEGEIVALVGTNGAGKSTLLRAIGGVVEADSGAIVFDGRDVTHMPPDEIARLGVAQMPGGEGVFVSLTVEENLRAAAWQRRREPGSMALTVEEALDRFPALASRRRDRAGDLSGGQQQLLALAMALISRPTLLLIDELSLGLAPVVVEGLLATVRELRDTGTSVLVVEQSVNVAVAVADRVYVMDSGRVVFEGPAHEVADRPELLRSIYLSGASGAWSPVPAAEEAQGGSPSDGAGPGAPPGGVPALALSEVDVSFGGIAALDAVSFSVGEGEVVGIIGPNGAGKTTLFDVVSGFTRADRGTVVLGGTDVTRLSPSVRSRRGLGRCFQDSTLFASLTVRETLAVALERSLDVRDPVNAALRPPVEVLTEAAVRARVDELVDQFGLGWSGDRLIRELSTGTRRLVDLACVVAHGPSVVLLDEPTSGVAQREIEAMGELLRRVRATLGATLVVVEHDIAFVAALADRLVALDRGQVLVEGHPREVLDHPQVVEAFLGGDPLTIHRSGAAHRAMAGIGDPGARKGGVR